VAKISVYFNDTASRAQGNVWKDSIKKFLFRHELTFRTPIDLEELENQLDEDTTNQTEYIFAVGGDGTANTIVQHINGTDIKLMVIPTGTANDFASELGLNRNLGKIIKVFLHQTFQRVDVIKINDNYMVSNGGIGLPANVAAKINRDRTKIKGFKKLMKFTGSMIYPVYFAKEMLFDFPRYKLNIHSPDFPKLETIIETSIVMINNQPKIGGNFSIAPQTRNNDGKFNVTIFTHKNKKDLIEASTMMMRGKYPHNDKELISFETDCVDITNLGDEQLTFFGDGEVLEKGQKL
jgi:diacylglycerol kinase (ATP)